MPVTPLPRPGEMFGRYRIVGRLGQGAMGVVLEAEQIDLGRRVALKLLTADLDGAGEPGASSGTDAVSRFRREATALARVDSAHVVQVFDAGEHDGWRFIATQVVPDGDLRALVTARGALPPQEALDLLDQVLAGLGDAHAVGVLHRDVKPSNVLVRHTPEGPRLLLCDFGIARDTDAGDTHSATRTEGVIGTWAYLSPERLLGETATPQADLYAAGCLLWFLLTGGPPYSGTLAQVAMAHQGAPIPQLGTGQAAGGRAAAVADRVLRRALAKNPAQRYRSVAEMRADLKAPAEPTTAYPPVAAVPAPLTLPRSVRAPVDAPVDAPEDAPEAARPRRPVMVGVLAVLVTLIVAGLVGVGVGVLTDDGDASEAATATNTKSPSGSAADRPVTGVTAEPAATDTADTTEPTEPATEPTSMEPSALTTDPGVGSVFPSFGSARECAEHRLATVPGRVQWWEECPTFEGHPVVAFYSEWTDVAAAQTAYDSWRKGSFGSIAPAGGYLRWGGVNDGAYKVTWVSTRAPYSVNVWLPERVYRGRDPADVMGALLASGVVRTS